jgi:hypothetical protein
VVLLLSLQYHVFVCEGDLPFLLLVALVAVLRGGLLCLVVWLLCGAALCWNRTVFEACDGCQDFLEITLE